MRRLRTIRTALLMALLGWFAVATISAQPEDKRTFFTFSAPVKLPRVTLPPGKYLFRIADPEAGGRVVQVLSPDGKELYTTFLTIPAERLDPPEKPELRFIETPANMPPAAKAWWYPGDPIGREFIYPKQEAQLLAKAASQPVLAAKTDATTVEQTKSAELSRVSASGQETNVDANDKPKASAATGEAVQGEAAPMTIVIVAVPRGGQ